MDFLGQLALYGREHDLRSQTQTEPGTERARRQNCCAASLSESSLQIESCCQGRPVPEVFA